MIKKIVRKHEKRKTAERNIQTIYYDYKGNIIRVNRSAYAHLAVRNAVDYMQLDYYQAKTVEVIDLGAGVPHAVLSWINKKLEILYKRNPKVHK